jgi:uncharacterized protein (DUF427 family)
MLPLTTLNKSRRESVWDYPRPPRLELSHCYLRILHCGVLLAETARAFRVLETSHPPVFYIPPSDIAMHLFKPSNHRASYCEFKGSATYWTLDLTLDPYLTLATPEAAISIDAAWSYDHPTPAFADLRNYLAFYASRVDECTVDGELVTPQSGDFYGGWITSNISGPFKGPPGTNNW